TAASLTTRLARPRCAALLAPPRPPRNLDGERIEARPPEGAEAVEPLVHLAEGGGLHRVQPARTLRAHGGEAALSQHTQVLGDGRLRDAELALHHLDDLARRPLALRQQLEAAPSHGIAENVERMHLS